jgi:Spy/CpxP family protein refolding chaperone
MTGSDDLPTPSDDLPRPPRRRRLLFIGAGALGLVGALVAAFVAFGPGAAGALPRRHGFFGGPGPGHGPGFGSPEEMRAHFERRASFLADLADATDEQQARIQAIAARLADELAPLAAQHRANRQAMFAALSGETVDRAALEQARTAELALAAQASSTLTSALADTAEVLSPAQRAKLAERHRRFHEEP